MIKVCVILILNLIILPNFFGQEIIKKEYYESIFGGMIVEEEDAKSVEYTIKESDGSIKYELRRTDTDSLMRRICYKDDVPVGQWILFAGDTLDFNFDLKYYNEKYQDIIQVSVDTYMPIDEKADDFTPPIFTSDYSNFLTYLSMNLVWPNELNERRIKGKVQAQFIINENGEVEDISIYKGVNKTFDKSIVRVIRECPKWTPATLDGNPVKVSLIVQTNVNIR